MHRPPLRSCSSCSCHVDTPINSANLDSMFCNECSGKPCTNPEFQRSDKEWKEKAEELKGVKEDLKAGGHFDGWPEMVSADVKERISSASEEVKEAFGFSHTASEEAKDQNSGSSGSFKTVFGKFTSPGVSSASQRLKNMELNQTKGDMKLYRMS